MRIFNKLFLVSTCDCCGKHIYIWNNHGTDFCDKCMKDLFNYRRDYWLLEVILIIVLAISAVVYVIARTAEIII